LYRLEAVGAAQPTWVAAVVSKHLEYVYQLPSKMASLLKKAGTEFDP
jgi:hypothetical protein